MDTFSQVQQIIAEHLRTPVSDIQRGSKASDLPNWDSLHHLTLIMQLEQAFGFQFDMEEIGSLDSVEKILAAVEKRARA